MDFFDSLLFFHSSLKTKFLSKINVLKNFGFLFCSISLSTIDKSDLSFKKHIFFANSSKSVPSAYQPRVSNLSLIFSKNSFSITDFLTHRYLKLPNFFIQFWKSSANTDINPCRRAHYLILIWKFYFYCTIFNHISLVL